jgi:hypothetical protein
MTGSAAISNASYAHCVSNSETFHFCSYFADGADHFVPWDHGEDAATEFVAGGHKIGVTDAAEL